MRARVAGPSCIQITTVYLPLPIDKFIGQPAIGLSCAMLIQKLKAGATITVLAQGFEHP